MSLSLGPFHTTFSQQDVAASLPVCDASTWMQCEVCPEQQTGMQLQHSCVQAALHMCKACRASFAFMPWAKRGPGAKQSTAGCHEIPARALFWDRRSASMESLRRSCWAVLPTPFSAPTQPPTTPFCTHWSTSHSSQPKQL